MREPTNSECCRRVQDAEVRDASTHAVENQQQRGGFKKLESREEP